MKLEDYIHENKIKKTDFASSVEITLVKLSKILSGRQGIDLKTAYKIDEKTNGEVTFRDWI